MHPLCPNLVQMGMFESCFCSGFRATGTAAYHIAVSEARFTFTFRASIGWSPDVMWSRCQDIHGHNFRLVIFPQNGRAKVGTFVLSRVSSGNEAVHNNPGECVVKRSTFCPSTWVPNQS